ncbi:MAG TPA: ATP-binding protein [Armatimonadota bacterium]
MIDSVARLQSIINAAPYGAHLYELTEDDRLVFLGANQSADVILGVDHSQFVGKTLEESFPALIETSVPETYRRVARTGEPHQDLQVSYNEQGIEGAYEVHAVQTAPSHIAVFFRDVTEREKAEAALRDSNLRYRALFESALDPIMLIRDEKIVDCNPRAAASLGLERREDLLGKAPWEHSPEVQPDGRPSEEAARQRISRALSGDPQLFEWHCLRADGSDLHFEVSLSAANLQGGPLLYVVARDLTERRRELAERTRLQEQLRQAQKMEAIGRLAGGVAHDFNNLLTAIAGYADLALSRMEESSPSARHLGEIRKATDRAAALTRQLLTFSRKQVETPQTLDLNNVVLDMDRMLRRLLGEDVELTTHLADALYTIRADPSQMEQVLLNLAVNARDAMPQGGKLTLETVSVDLDETYARQHTGITPGPHVMLAISDTGCGMDEEVLSHIFEPFFTTKAKGKGTGLGLSTVYGIVQQSGGGVWVYSEVGKGTTFRVYLPAVSGAPSAVMASSQVPTPPRGTERLLIVEDDEAVRALLSHILGTSGYTVLVASQGTEALELFRAESEHIDLVITDVIMPGMNGRELAARLQEIRPATKVLFVSGYTNDAIAQHGVLDRGVAFLPKPFTTDALARKVREVLESE